MADDDDDLYDDDDENLLGEEDGDSEAAGGPGSGGDDDDENSIGISRRNIREWLTRRRGWVLIFGLAIAQGVFALLMLFLRSEAKPVAEIQMQHMRDLAVDMLGHEVKIGQVYQLLPMRGGKRMTVGLDIVLVLGQLPEEQIEGAPRPNDQEMAMFIQAIQDMEPRIRSRVNSLLQKIPAEDYGGVEVYKVIKDNIKNSVNDSLDGLDFGKGLRKGIGKRRVTDVLLPMFVRQMMR